MKKSLLSIPLSILLAAAAAFAQGPNTPRAQLIEHGREYFRGACTGCHNGYEVEEGVWSQEGRGYAGGVPPLANSDFFMAIRLRPVSIILDGLSDPITVNGLEYNGYMPPHRENEDFDDFAIAGIVTYIRAVLNDSNVVSCNPAILDEEGFAACTMTARNPTEIANDSVAVWEVTNVRGGITRVASSRPSFAPSSRSFRVTGAGSHSFVVPAGLSARATLRIVDAWGRTVWSTRVSASDRAVRWNGAAANGRKVVPGLYVARFEGFAPVVRAPGAAR